MNTNDYYRAVLLGFVIGMASLSLIVQISTREDVKPVEPKSNFEVVDTYKGCDVVRYAVPNGAKYHYFLDCSNK
jgi:hypothetical protein